MKLEQQVVSLELAKKLKKLGVKQDSLFWWVRGEMEYGYEGEWHINETEEEKYFLFNHEVGRKFEDYDLKPNVCDIGNTDEQYDKWKKENKAGLKRMRKTIYSAFTVAELGELSANYTTFMKTQKGTWLVRWTDTQHYDFGAEKYHQEVADTEADARAEMLIYLLENNLLTQKP